MQCTRLWPVILDEWLPVAHPPRLYCPNAGPGTRHLPLGSQCTSHAQNACEYEQDREHKGTILSRGVGISYTLSFYFYHLRFRYILMYSASRMQVKTATN